MRKLLVAVFIGGVIIFSFVQYYHVLKNRIVPSDLKRLTETRIGSFLKVPVHVERIKVGLLEHISLSGVEVGRLREGYPVLIGVKNIAIRYDLVSFLKRNFRIPAEIFIDTPHLTFQKLQFPPNPFEFAFLRSERGIVTRFEFDEGEIQIPWFRPVGRAHASPTPLRLVHVEGRAEPKKGDLFDIRFKANLSGAASGSLLAYGEIKPEKQEYHLEISLKDVTLAAGSRLPVTGLSGTLELENRTVRMRKVKFFLRGIPCELTGEIRDVFSEKPAVRLGVNFRERKMPLRADVHADFKQETFSGTFRGLDQEYRFLGQVVGRPRDFRIHHLSINDVYYGSGEVNLDRSIYRIELERESERIRIDFFIGGFVWQMVLKLDHTRFFGYDLVTYMILDFKPHEELWRKGRHVFEVQAKTDYLIFQHAPLRDFRLSAQLSAEGLNEILARWGNVSELQGKILFRRVPDADLLLEVGPLSLSEFDFFGMHPLSLDGILEGKLEILGPVDRPHLTGAVTVEQGKAGSLEYDRATLNFSGQAPYLVLKDSKVWKGSSSFLLKGGLNFELRNFLEGVELDNSERVVIWKGLELSTDQFRRGLRRADTNRMNVEAEYKMGNRTSIRVTAEEDQAKKEYLAVGPKVKF